MEGFLVGAKQSGTETTNCKRRDLRDDHLWIAESADQIGKTRGGLWEIHPITTIEVFSGGSGESWNDGSMSMAHVQVPPIHLDTRAPFSVDDNILKNRGIRRSF